MNRKVTSGLTVPADHPSLAGHFPGQPVVPAVVLLDAVLAAVRTSGDFALRSIPSVKFLQPVLPEEHVELRLDFSDIDAVQVRVRFEGFRAAIPVFEGSFILSAGSGP